MQADPERRELNSSVDLFEYLFAPFSGSADVLDELHFEQDLIGGGFVAECMANLGFEYVPFAVNDDTVPFNAVANAEYVGRYGFGYSTTYFEPADDAAIVEVPTDPNETIYASLSADEQVAYMEAMFGDPNDEDDGCHSERFNASVPELEIFNEFYPGFEDASDRAEADQRVVDLRESWPICMRDAGFPFDDRTEMFEDLDRRVAPFDEAIDQEWLRLDEVGLGQEPSSMPPELRDAHEDLITYELGLAAADLECDVFDAVMEVHDEYARKFVEDNALALRDYLSE